MRSGELAATNDEAVSEPSLTRGDWIAAALELLYSEGIDAVRITRLAETLGMTRGSFYWHFKDRDDLCAALIAHWERTNTAAILSAVADSKCLDEGVLDLFDTWLDGEVFQPRLDSAMRDWARRSTEVRTAVELADAARINAVAAMFARHGFEDTEALIRARIIYFTQVGYYAMGMDETLVQRIEYLEAYYLGFVGRDLDPELAQAYREKRLGTS